MSIPKFVVIAPNELHVTLNHNDSDGSLEVLLDNNIIVEIGKDGKLHRNIIHQSLSDELKEKGIKLDEDNAIIIGEDR